MSLQEMKEEFKQSEGDPHVKGRIRQLRQVRMKKRMMAAVPKASVVITNPTHYAVALSYERGMSAPVCVAKGVDTIALKIREIAAEHDVPVVENVPLARALHAPWRSTTRSRWNTIMRSPRLSATSWVSSAGFPAGGRDSFAARKYAGNERNEQKASLTGLRSRARFRHSGEAREKRVPSMSTGCVPSHDRRN
jgi:hypothetical protein